MKFYGLQKVSLVDYPGYICATLFTGGCNMDCPYCHNPELIRPSKNAQIIDETEVIDFLRTRIGKLDAVCVTGGEPTLHKDLLAFFKKIKQLGFLVKLDTNGTNPAFLERVFDQQLVDYVAMDIKIQPSEYSLMGWTGSQSVLLESIQHILNSGVDHEFRTTVVNGIHTLDSLKRLCPFVSRAQCLYLQRCRQLYCQSDVLKKIPDFTLPQLEAFANSLREFTTCPIVCR